MAAPKRDKQLNVRVTERQLRTLWRLAKARQMTASELIRMWIVQEDSQRRSR